MEFYPAHGAVPQAKRTERLLLQPLLAAHVDLDYDAVMSSTALLRRWSQSSWPAEDFTRAENLADLERHEREHLERQAFTFTVLDPAARRCLGCVYFTPAPPEAQPMLGAATHAARVGFWVRESELARDLDAHLLATLREWLAAEWAFDAVALLVSREDERQLRLLEDSGLGSGVPITLGDGRECQLFATGPAAGSGSSRTSAAAARRT